MVSVCGSTPTPTLPRKRERERISRLVSLRHKQESGRTQHFSFLAPAAKRRAGLFLLPLPLAGEGWGGGTPRVRISRFRIAPLRGPSGNDDNV